MSWQNLRHLIRSWYCWIFVSRFLTDTIGAARYGAFPTQVLMVFFLPLITAGIHLSFAFPLITRLLKLFSMHNIFLFGMCMLGCFLVFAIFYTIVYSMTAKTYYKIVQ